MQRDMDTPFWTPLLDTPSEDLISALTTLLPSTKLTERTEEETHAFLTSALQHVLQHPALHWWCNPQLRPISMEMLTLFGFEENESLKGYKSALENVLGGCLDCTESYQQDRRIFINRLQDEFGAEITEAFYEAILRWDSNRLIWRMEHLSTAAASSELQKRKKICMCDMMLDPTALLDHRFSGTFTGYLTGFLLDLFQAKKVKIQSVLPGIWLMLLHDNTIIQDWALYTSKLGASMETITADRWAGWEPFKVVWKLALDLVDGSLPGRDSAIPLTLDPARIWMGIRSMLSGMDAQVMHDAVKYDSETWNTFRNRLTTAVQDPTTPPTVFLETSRILFYLLGSLKQVFWVKDDSSLPSVSKAGASDNIYSSRNIHLFKERRTKGIASKDLGFLEHVSWVSSFINSLPSTITLSGRLLIATDVLLDCLSGPMKDRIITRRPTADDDDLQYTRLDYDFKLLKLVFDLLRQQESRDHKISSSLVLSPHWNWIGPVCALGPSALLPASLPESVEQEVIAVSNAALKFVIEALKEIVETMWSNYDVVIKSVRAVSVGVLERSNAELWFRIAEALPSKTPSELQALPGSDQARLQEWETLLIETSSQLALLPKAETRPHFTKDALELCGRFNDDLGFFFQSNSIILQALSYHGVPWNQRLLNQGDKRFLTKLLKLWCSPNQETGAQALFIMRSGWDEVTRSSCLRRAFMIGGDSSIEELDNILSDFRNRKTPGGATPPVLFQFLLDSVTTLFLTNSIDGEGGLYLQIFLELASSQEVARHLQMIKQLWNSIWQSMKAAFLAGRTIWNDRQERNETVKTMKVVVDVGLLIIGKIRYFERLLQFENQDIDFDAPDLDQPDFVSSSQGRAAAKETMPLEFMKAALARMTDWIYAQDTMLCTAALNLVCAVLDLLAEHDDMIDEADTKALTALAAGNQEPKSLLTEEQREHLWIALSRHSAYPSRSEPSSSVVPETIEISDDDFGDIDEVDLTGFEFDDMEEPEEEPPQPSVSEPPKAAPFIFRPTPANNPYLQTKLNFNQVDPYRPGIPAGGTLTRKLPSSLTKMNISPKPAVRVAPLKKGSKLSQMRADHTRERRSIVEASKERQMSKAMPILRAPVVERAKPQSDSESPSESEAEDDNNGLSSLIDTEESWNDRNKPKVQRKTKLLELKDIAPRGTVIDPSAYRRQKAKEDYERIQRLTPNLTNLHTQILKWEVSATGDRPPDNQEYRKVPSTFDSVEAYAKAFEPLLVLECWQQLMAAREECNQSSDSIMVQVVNRVSTSHFQDTHARVPKDKASGIMVDDIVVMADPSVRDVFTEKGNATRAKPFFAKVQSIVRSKGECEVVFRTCLKIEESSALMFVRPLTRWSVLKLMNLTTTHREYAALIAMRHYDLCDDILKPPTAHPPKPAEETLRKLMGTFNVNTPQAMAIAGALAKPNGFTLIQGPPGTGKTKTILGLVGAFLDDGSRRQQAPSVQSLRGEKTLETGTVSRILVCAPSNAAIDEIVKRLKGGIRNTQGAMVSPKVVRIGTMETVNAEVKDVALEALIAKELESKGDASGDQKTHQERMNGLREKMKQITIDVDHARLELVQVKQGNNMMAISEAQAKIKALNTSKWKLGQELDQARSSYDELNQKKDQARKDARDKILTEADVICSTLSASGHDLLTSSNFTFDTVIIDEAAQSVEISSLIPLKYGTKRCVLVGDPNQLPPTVMSQLATKFDYNRSLFVRIQGLAPTSVHLLSIQYRMHPDISVFPSRAFYKSLLKDGPNMAEKTRAEWHVSKITPPYKFFDVRHGREKVGLSHSQHNPIEAETAVDLLDFLCRGNKSLNFFRRVGVISPYKQQIRTLKEYFSRHFGQKILEAVDFNTVDGFQGQEKDIIIFSCVRASNSGSVGFLSDIRRMNVALTRARQSLFILGHAETLRREPIWGDLVRDAEARGHYVEVAHDFFGPKYSQLPQNILQPKIEVVDRRNELYGRVADHRKAATIIEQPEAIMEDVIETESYPSLPTVDEPAPISRPSSRGSRVSTPRDAWDGRQPKPEDMDIDSPPRKPRSTELQDRINAEASKDAKDAMPIVDRPPLDQVSSNHGHKRKNSSPERPSSDKQPPPRKPAPSLFLKSKPMSMKNGQRPNSSASTIPVRERLAATVAPIRKSYPSGDGHARPPPPARRDTGPSLDQLLDTLKKPKS